MINRRTLVLSSLAVLPASLVATPEVLVRARGTRLRTRAKPRRKITTRTFLNQTAMSTPTEGVADPYPSTIQVRGLRKRVVQKVTVTLHELTHGKPQDMDVLLVAPNNKGVILMSDAAGGTVDASAVNITFNDAAPRQIPPLLFQSGTFKPTNRNPRLDPFPAPAPGGARGADLATFNGINPNGAWRLFVLDDTEGDVGIIAGGWSLTIRATSKPRRRRNQ